jgi:cysteinyl-tRNA synthetase
MFLYNTLTQTKEEFRPTGPWTTMYVCGPTVYDRPHIGNARPAVVFDTLYRLLMISNHGKVKYARNYTDIDDKIISAAEKNNEAIFNLTKRMISAYEQDIHDGLNVSFPTFMPRATDYIPDMIRLIERIITNGHAYVVDGNVLFSVASVTINGLVNHEEGATRANVRKDIGLNKRDPRDFVLWKPAKEGEISWPSPWGEGRPGWHIECSAMSSALLGETFDIHAGGHDLIFPHHEAEIYQNVGAFGVTPARFWLHNGHVTVNGRKMSKSEGNFITVQDILKDVRGDVARLALLTPHYRQPFDWNDRIVEQAQANMEKFHLALMDHDWDNGQFDDQFISYLNDDLNTPKAFQRLHELAGMALKGDGKAANALVTSAQMVGLMDDPDSWWDVGFDEDEINRLVQARHVARSNKQWATADEIRQQLSDMGVSLEDTQNGTIWRVAYR